MPKQEPTPQAKPKRTPAPRQAYRFPTLKAWVSNEENTEWTKNLLMDHRFLALCHYIEQTGEVSEKMLVGTPVLDSVIVRQAAFNAGLRSFPRRIVELLVEKKKPGTEPLPYEHIHPNNQ